MSEWRVFARGPLGSTHIETVSLPTGMSASDVRARIWARLDRMPARPTLCGVRLAVDGWPWINAGQFRGRESAEIIAAILSPAIARRPSWLMSCRQDGQYRAASGVLDASEVPLPIASTGRHNAHVRFARDTGQRWARANNNTPTPQHP